MNLIRPSIAVFCLSCAARPGIIFFLAAFNILSWGRSWPLFIIAAGLMPLIERALTTQAQQTYPYSGTSGAAGTTPPASSTPSASSGEEVR